MNNDVVTTDIADLVVASIDSGSWSPEIQSVERKWVPYRDLEKLTDQTLVQVVPRAIELTKATRLTDYHVVPVEIGIMRKPSYGTDIEAEADRQAELVQQLCDWFRCDPGNKLGNLTGASQGEPHVITVEVPTLMYQAHLEENHQLTSVLRLECQTRR